MGGGYTIIKNKTSYNIFEKFTLGDIEEGYDDYFKVSGYGTYKITCDIGYKRKTLRKLLIIGCCCCLCDLGICFIIRAYKKNKWIKEAKQRLVKEVTEDKE